MLTSESRIQAVERRIALALVPLLGFTLILEPAGLFAEEKRETVPAEGVKELKLLKNTPELLEQKTVPGGLVPPLSAPEAPALTLAPKPVLGQDELEKAEKQGEKERNWLVEGYWRQVREHTRRADRGGRLDTEWLKSTLGAEAWLQKGVQSLQVSGDKTLDVGEGRKSDAETRDLGKPSDPLQPFLATWMTPRDYQILQKAGQGAESEGGSTGSERPVAAPQQRTQTVSENPYLKALNEGILAADKNGAGDSGLLPTLLPGGGGQPPAKSGDALLPQQDSEAEKPAVPASKSDEDRKYYPQLKRF